MDELIKYLPPMLYGSKLLDALSELPPYDASIRDDSAAERLISLSTLYQIYIPSAMSAEIYNKLYLAVLRSLRKKETTAAVTQRNENHKAILQRNYNSILGGADSFTVIGTSGIGKSCAINKAIELISAKGMIETTNPYTTIIPCLCVQCPFDSSIKGMLLEILRKVDEIIGSDYYSKALRIRTTTDTLIGTVSQVSLNHIGLLVVDEIQNVVGNKHGAQLIAMLTQLINNSGISICMVGTPQSVSFFESAIHLARRSLGLQYSAIPLNDYFYDFCETLFTYQYTKKIAELTDATIRWLYEHSGGIVSAVISLFHDAQEIAILNSSEMISIATLQEAYEKRLSMLHAYINPPKKHNTQSVVQKMNIKPTTVAEQSSINHNCIADAVLRAKSKDGAILPLLQTIFAVEVVDV